VVVQSYRPDHYSIQAAAQQDYDAFYRQEMEARRELNYPPFSHLVNLVVTGEEEQEVTQTAHSLAESVRRLAQGRGIDVLGPAPAPIARLRKRYRWHLLVRGPALEVQEAVREAIAGMVRRETCTVAVDVDPVSLM
jgi:primosomal protein N' (replication factor Y)